MTNEKRNASDDHDPDRRFAACVAACFGDMSPEEIARLEANPDDARVLARVRRLVAAVAEPSFEAPPTALVRRAVQLFGERETLLRRWLASVRRIVLDLVTPEANMPLAGLRSTAAPLRTYRTPDGAEISAWVDMQVEPAPGAVDGRRVRGRVGLADGDHAPARVHAMRGDHELLTSVPLDPDGGFVLLLDAAVVDLVVELADGERALAIVAVPLRG